MNKLFYFVTLLISTSAIGQTRNTIDTNIFDELSVAINPALKDVVGRFKVSNGFAGQCYLIDSNNTFRLLYFDCVSRLTVDSGRWVIKNNLIVLTSKRTSTEFRVFHFMTFTFLIRKSQVQKFQQDFKTAVQRFMNCRPFEIGDRIFSPKEMAANSIGFKYLMADTLDDAGT